MSVRLSSGKTELLRVVIMEVLQIVAIVWKMAVIWSTAIVCERFMQRQMRYYNVQSSVLQRKILIYTLRIIRAYNVRNNLFKLERNVFITKMTIEIMN